MKLSEGRIGNAEGISLLGITLAANGIFVLDIAEEYRRGNLTFLTFPGALLFGLAVFLLLFAAVSVSGKKDLPSALDYAFGRLGGNAVLAILTALLVFDAYCLISRFVTAVHILVYGNDTVFSILLSVLGMAAFAALRGFECIGRLAKSFALVLLLLLVSEMLLPAKSYAPYRLFPFPSAELPGAAAGAFRGGFASLPPLMLLLCMTKGVQGMQSTVRIGVISAAAATVLTAAAQLCIGMVFSAEELKSTFIPLYELNSKILQESYFFRLDKVALFLWLIGAVIAAAYELYGAANLYTRRFSKRDVRPAVVAFSLVVLFMAVAEHRERFSAVQRVFYFVYRYGAAALSLPLAAAAGITAMKTARERRKKHENT